MANQGWRFLGDSAPVREFLASITRLLPRLGPGRRVPPILLQGETGTGKGLLARTIHETGLRAAGPFVDLNCAAIPATLIEAELFGFERGAFTDARQARTGLVEAAHRGTLFLDEIGLVPEGLQAKLLTVLETREVRPLGGTRTRAVDVSIIAATNSDLREAVRERRFREDLYHRLAVLVFSLPPLRQRGDDVLELADAFLARACADHALKKELAEDARAAIAAYRWPGNVRELANLMERVALLTEGSIVTAADLALPAVSIASTPTDREPPDVLSLRASVDTFTRARVEQALNEARGNISAAAERLGVPRSTLRYQLERFGLTQGGMGRARRRTVPATPPLSERVLVRARTVEGERRQVTVLFADFTEAMDRVADGDPEATRQRFDPVLETMIDAIQRHQGSVNHVRHDGLMALFGAPAAHEDHAVRACYAALSMHESVGHLVEGMRSSLGGDVRVRIGVHSGDVALRMIGNDVRLDYAAMPETTHEAARTQQAARPGTTLITAETLRLAEAFIEVAPAPLAGAYELRAPSVVRSRLRAAIARSLSQFVGRDAETEQIGTAMDRARSGRGQVVALVGEPGVGKSRLVYEFTRSHRAQQWLVLEASALSYGKATSYLPVIDLLKAYFKITERETHREIREKVTGKLLTLDRALEPILPAVLTLLDVPIEDSQWQVLDPSQRGSASWRPSSNSCCARAGINRSSSCSRTCTGLTPRHRHSWTGWWRFFRPPGCSWSLAIAPNTSSAGPTRRTTRHCASIRSTRRAPLNSCRPCSAATAVCTNSDAS
jgi:DNA-binding NtrC family response regulator/class 3 adenylate cyclase